MTTIAYKNGIIAADTGVSVGNTFIGELTKIFKVEFTHAELLGGVAGDCDKSTQFIQWAYNLNDEFINAIVSHVPSNLRNCEDLRPYGKAEEPFEAFIVIRHDNYRDKIFTYESSGIAVEIVATIFANGSGRDLALGAMGAKLSAEQSVQIACKYDIFSNEPIPIIAFNSEN